MKAFDKFINGEINQMAYDKGTKYYDDQISSLKSRIVEIDIHNTDFLKYINYDFSLLRKLGYYYLQANTTTKRKIIGSIFPEKLIFDGDKYQTQKINEVLSGLTKNINELGEIKKRQKIKSDNLSLKVSPRGVEPLLQE